jgi:predicted dehydrogenase
MTESLIRWGIVGTADIAKGAFLPALRAAGGGVPYAVASRDLRRAEEYAAANGIEHAMEDYHALCTDSNVDAVYVATPNGVHEEPAETALRAGKAVFCEKPLCGTVLSTERLLTVARESGSLLWEAFVLLFAEQTDRLMQLIESGAIGDLRQVYSSHHFALHDRYNVRLNPALEGGALQDVGCYSVRLARLVFGTEAESAVAVAQVAPEGVDEQLEGVLRFPDQRTLMISSSMCLPQTTFARVIGTEGEIRISNPFHAQAGDTMKVIVGQDTHVIHSRNRRPTFTPQIEHIHAVLRGEEAPRHLAVDEALGNALAIEMLYQASGLGTPTAG